LEKLLELRGVLEPQVVVVEVLTLLAEAAAELLVVLEEVD
jgi:hypothetical protein